MTDNSELWQLTASDLTALVRQRKVSAQQATQSALDRLDEMNPGLNAVVQDTRDSATAQAASVDAAIARGEDPGPLAGIPVTVKVNIDQAGYANTNGLRLQRDKIATSDHPVVTALLAAGAVIIGRTNTPAFSMRWFCRNSLHGETLNPINPALTPGGSSGGAAAAAAAGIGPVAHGTDIAGSIRYPAYACGIHGLRPTLGRVAAWNASSPDRFLAGQLMAVSGPLARSIDDIALAFEALIRPDYRDPWHVPVPLTLAPYPRKIAVCIEPEGWQVNAAVRQTVEHAASELQDQGWEVVEADFPPIREAAAMNLALWMAEMEQTGTQLVHDEDDPDANVVFARLCDYAKTVDSASPQIIMQQRAGLIRRWQHFFNDYAAVLCPVSGELPFDNHADVGSDAAFDRIVEAQLLQIGLPLLGLPGLTVTTGTVDDPGTSSVRPTGVQLIANRFREDILLDLGKTLEQVYGVRPIAGLQS